MRRHLVVRRLGVWAAAVAAVLVLAWAAFVSPLLALDMREVSVTGQGSTIDVAQVQAVIGEEVGVPLPRIDTVALRQRLLELNGVRDASILRDWPHGLAVTLTSREPVAAAPVDDGFALVDADGVRVGTTPEPPEGLPVVEASLDDDQAPALVAALRVLAGLPAELADQVTQVSAATRDDVRTTLSSGQVIKWGSDDRVALKLAVVQALRQAAPDAQVFDVSSPDLPVTR
ncbi:cell division protein FtsQ/DivIB [Xylanimonas ulmi]|uniref:Cell division protein FtsQ n=1 Tax=Xylanimonas ulmi TaxID=228973 RepID=A0A4Q7M462_9MICO|nr:cell division protein FtsQ/DivIB [Xylanibacterium ulmi]RZS61288.1 cell division protein FtsQ [Xylanibacterium ulmi]